MERHRSHNIYGDRFIPYRGSQENMRMTQGLLTIPTKQDRKNEIVSPEKEAYRKLLADTLLEGRTRILSFHGPPSGSSRSIPALPCSTDQVQPVKKIRKIPKEPTDSLAVPGVYGYRQLNLFDWGSNNLLAAAIGNTVHLCNPTDFSNAELLKVFPTSGPVSSVSWSPGCHRVAIGLNNSHVIVYDAYTGRPERTFSGIHKYLVGSLAWKDDCILTTAGADSIIVNNDVRIRSHEISRYEGHTRSVSSLKWSSSGNYLASGGFDKLVHVWDASKSTSLHRFNNHTTNVRALAWCPYESNILTSGGGDGDHSIKFWDVITGKCSNSIDTGSEVCSLLFNKNAQELLSSHGSAKNQLALWRYPSMVQMAEITGHTAPVVYLALGPDECTVASLSEDDTMKMWEIFEKKPGKNCKPRTTHSFGPCNMYSQIR